jgi:hypothetical protein
MPFINGDREKGKGEGEKSLSYHGLFYKYPWLIGLV